MIEQLLFFVAIVGSMAITVRQYGASRYDIHEAKKEQEFARSRNARRFRRRPLITVIIQAVGDLAALEASLQSVMTGSYRTYEVVVTSAQPNKRVASLIADYQAKYQRQALYLFQARTKLPQPKILARAYKRYGSGEAILVLTAGDTLAKDSLQRASKQLLFESATELFYLHEQPQQSLRLASRFQAIDQTVQSSGKKSASYLRTNYAPTSKTILYRQTAFCAIYKSRARYVGNTTSAVSAYNSMYLNSVMVCTPAAQTFASYIAARYQLQLQRIRACIEQLIKGGSRRRVWFRWLQLPLSLLTGLAALAVPVLQTYFIYLAVQLHEPSLLMASWLLLATFLLLAVWNDHHTRLAQKLQQTSLIPVSYIIFYLVSFVQVVAAVASVVRPKAKNLAQI